jgi:hypothetical protein
MDGNKTKFWDQNDEGFMFDDLIIYGNPNSD